MAKPILEESLWQLVEPVLPPPKPRRRKNAGRKPISNRQALTGILFVLKTGIPWEYLPQELGCGSGMTYWRRLRDWQAAGVWDRLHQVLLDVLQEQGALDWSVVVIDSSSVRAVGAKRTTGSAKLHVGHEKLSLAMHSIVKYQCLQNDHLLEAHTQK